jgi:hypothetical protein
MSYQPPSYPPNQQAPVYHSQQQEQTPGLPPRRTDTDAALPTGQDRAEQVETMQAFEASKEQSEDEKNQEMLQREFPKIDGSLIAAIYGDSGSLSATREMLMELNEGAEGAK